MVIIAVMEVKNVELLNNDAYFMEIVNNMIVVNDNYKGLIIFDSELRLIEKIELIEELTIYASFKNGNKILLFCPDNGCFIYVNIELRVKKIIPLTEFDNYLFSTIYDWDQENLILSDYQGHFIKVDLNKGVLAKVDSNDMECQNIREDYDKLSGVKIYKVCGLEKEAFIQFSDSNYSLVDYKQNINILRNFEKEQYHDFEAINGYLAKIGENKVEILFNNNIEVRYSSEYYDFLKGKFMLENGEVYLFLLSGNRLDPNHIKIEKLKLCNEVTDFDTNVIGKRE